MPDLAQVLRDAGLEVHDHRVPGRGHLEPRGVMLHHDAIGPAITRARGVEVMQNGRPPSKNEPKGLPGPLANAWVDRTGAWCLITDQRANHAGSCSSVALAETFAGRAPDRDARDRGLSDDTTIGNRYLYGIEVANNGVGEPYPDVQIESLARGVAALLGAWGLHAGHVIHHRQATSRKIDMSYRGPIRELITAHLEDLMATPTQHIGCDPTGQWWIIEGPIATPIRKADADLWLWLGVPRMPDAQVPAVLRVKAKGVPAA